MKTYRLGENMVFVLDKGQIVFRNNLTFTKRDIVITDKRYRISDSYETCLVIRGELKSCMSSILPYNCFDRTNSSYQGILIRTLERVLARVE